MKQSIAWEELSETARGILELTLSEDGRSGATVNFTIGKEAVFEADGEKWTYRFTPEVLDEIRAYSSGNADGDSYKITQLGRFVSVRLARMGRMPVVLSDSVVHL